MRKILIKNQYTFSLGFLSIPAFKKINLADLNPTIAQ